MSCIWLEPDLLLEADRIGSNRSVSPARLVLSSPREGVVKVHCELYEASSYLYNIPVDNLDLLFSINVQALHANVVESVVAEPRIISSCCWPDLCTDSRHGISDLVLLA